MMYKNEIEIYPDIIKWLKKHLDDKYKFAETIQVRDTHDKDLTDFIIELNYQKFFPEFTTYKIRQDITGFIEYEDRVELVFVEVKIGELMLKDLSQLIGYSCVPKPFPIVSILISPGGMGSTLSKLLTSYNRKDILEFRTDHKIQVLKWDSKKQDIDRMNSIT